VELRQLQYFVAVARHGSFTRAAEELWLTQSALSQQVRRLEAELGVALLHRTPRGAALTAAGEELLPRAEAALAQLAEARTALHRHADATRGRARVAVTPAEAPALPAALAAFKRAHPGVQVALRQASSAQAAALVGAGTVDLAVTSVLGAPPAGVGAVALSEEPLRAILAPEDPPEPVARLLDLRGRPFVLAEPGSALRAIVMAACQAAGFSPRSRGAYPSAASSSARRRRPGRAPVSRRSGAPSRNRMNVGMARTP